MTRSIPWLMAALLAAGCSVAPTASLSLEAAGPGYAVQRTFVLPHVLERSGTISSSHVEFQGLKWEAKVVRSGQEMPITLQSFVVNAHTDNLKLAAKQDELSRAFPEGVDQDCDGLADLDGDGALDVASSYVEITIKGGKEDLTLKLLCPKPDAKPARAIGAGVVSDIIEFAGMAISEQGIPARKAKKAAK